MSDETFVPCVMQNGELRTTEMLLEDCLTVWRPWPRVSGLAVDLGYDENGKLVGIRLWDTVAMLLEGEKP